MIQDKEQPGASSGFHYEGRRVIVDDISRLDELSDKGPLAEKGDIDNYVEEVTVEYYIPNESRFVARKLYFYIPLFDPEPRSEDKILKKHIRSQKFFDLSQVIEDYPKYKEKIYASYEVKLDLYGSISESMKGAKAREVETRGQAYSKALYLCESLAQYEPTVASLEFLGDFLTWNFNYLIRSLNRLRFPFSLSDFTTAYLIKRRDMAWEARELPYDENFEILKGLFLEQAFPGRSLEEFRSEHVPL